MKPLLEIKNLNINYKNSIKAVKDVVGLYFGTVN